MTIGVLGAQLRAMPALLAMLLAMPLATAADAATTGAEAQQAYLAGNAAEITRLVRDTAAWDKSADTNELYARAFVQFRALQLALAAKNEALAEKSGTACVTALNAAVKRQPRFAEAFALQSACYGYMANLGGFGAIRNGSRSGRPQRQEHRVGAAARHEEPARDHGRRLRAVLPAQVRRRRSGQGLCAVSRSRCGLRCRRGAERPGGHCLGACRGALLGRALCADGR
jgi:hypothetical protein